MKKIFLSLLFLFMCISLSSCSTFIGESEDIIIKSVTQELGKNEKGEDGFYIIIEYENEDRIPDKFFVPNGKKGEVGDTGNGIKEVTSEINKETLETTITITFTDPSIKPVQYTIPGGVTMTKPTIEKLENGDTKVTLNYSDGTLKTEFILPKGEKGDTFIGFECKKNEDGSQELTLNFSGNQEPVKVTIPAPSKGETGRGIKTIVSSTVGDQWYLTVFYTDDNFEEISFNRPNTWLSGDGSPAGRLGIVGDFYFDLQEKAIYKKISNNTWDKIIKLDNSIPESCTVKFNPNCQLNEYEWDDNTLTTIVVDKGSTFGTTIKFPVIRRRGYKFKGWYLVMNPGVTNGPFTDTTPVNGNMELFAHWEKE